MRIWIALTSKQNVWQFSIFQGLVNVRVSRGEGEILETSKSFTPSAFLLSQNLNTFHKKQKNQHSPLTSYNNSWIQYCEGRGETDIHCSGALNCLENLLRMANVLNFQAKVIRNHFGEKNYMRRFHLNTNCQFHFHQAPRHLFHFLLPLFKFIFSDSFIFLND